MTVKVYPLKLYDDVTCNTILLPMMKYLLDNTNYEVSNNFNEADVVFIFLQNASRETRIRLTEVMDGVNIELLKNYDYFFTKLSELIKTNSSKRFLLYTRMDQSTLDSCYKNYFLKHSNFVLLIKDYLSVGFNNHQFLIDCRNLMSPEIEEEFGFKNGIALKSTFPGSFNTIEKMNILKNNVELFTEEDKNKMFLFSFLLHQYSFWRFAGNQKILNQINAYLNQPKIYDIFFAKHQRNTVDGVARKYLLKTKMPLLKEANYNINFFESLDVNTYHSYLSKSKIVISPYGMGERVDDDLRAPLYDTIVIKPECSNVYDYNNLFNSKPFNKYHKINFTQHVVFCKPDFSDLEEVIDKILNNYEYYLNITKKYKQECIDFIKTDKYKDDFLETLNNVLG
jgi:hypothetical protein